MNKIKFISILILAGCGSLQDDPNIVSNVKVSVKQDAYQTDSTINSEGLFRINVAEQDKIDSKTDKEYGIGDDNLFDADEFNVYKLTNGFYKNVSNVLNDYNLSTAFSGNLSAGYNDTLLAIIDFPGLHVKYNNNVDTSVVINQIDFFNGNRKSAKDWKKGGALKSVLLYRNSIFLGKIILYDTYKMQSVLLPKPIVCLTNSVDTLKIIVEEIYSKNGSLNCYYLSELKFEGTKKY
ncbi:hypothetical protein [Rurimicrobium arvi]|uniref:Lipoprotein n=1 Tax=Rurimicrobium arvi TaxID=2049916 RepID=A0ABP8MID0_9BACT